jgi:maltose alpha-D-glucosyltransferase / alpha-amylase
MATRKKTVPPPVAAPADPLWYKDGVIYQTHVRAFFDSNADGIGDFPGLTRKLDYLQDLGVTAIWLLPFYPSPLRDDGYDIAEYTAIHPSYGTLADFRTFLREAHERGLRVITELVINHTSDQHPWFQKSRRAKPGSPWRDFYVWSDTPDKYTDARIIFKDFETSNWAWDPVAKAYYWHRFFSHQPDLNFDNPAVHNAIFKALDFWMDMGVDAFRLDAVPYLFEREGTTCENLPETHVFLKKVRRHIDEKYPNRMLLAEANQWPEDSLPYFGDGDECQMAFNFPVMPRMYMALAQEDRFPIVDIMAQTPAIPENCQWAVFLRNHDELTLEMVTDEDRDYMYRTYAKDTEARINLGIRRRLAPLLGNHRGRIQLMNGLLFSFLGTPIIYYGDEIGMGDNIYLGDRNGVRTPMQWSADRNAGFSRANPQKLYLPTIIDPQYHYEALNVETEQNSPHSLLWWTKRLIAMRKRYQAFGRGSLEFLQPENRKVLAFVRRYGEQVILVVANLSRLVQCVELDLSQYRDMRLVELSGRTEFPPIADRPYFLNLGPYAFYWFALERKSESRVDVDGRSREELPVIGATDWKELFGDRNRDALERALMPYVQSRRWFGGKSRKISSMHVREGAAIPGGRAVIALLDIEYVDGDPETYQLPLAMLSGRRSSDAAAPPAASIARLGRDGETLLYEPVSDPAFAEALLDVIARKRTLHGEAGDVRGYTSIRFRELRGDAPRLEPQTLRGEQSNTAIVYGGRLFLKLFRRLEPGVNTDLEVSRFLGEETSFENTPPLAGWLEYQPPSGEAMTLGILQGYAEGATDAWRYTLDSIGQFFERLLSDPSAAATIDKSSAGSSPLELSDRPIPAAVSQLLGSYTADAELLGQRTAQMHRALAMSTSDRTFAPEPFTPHYQRSIYQHIRTQIVETAQMLRRRMETLPEASRTDARQFIEKEEALQTRLRAVLGSKIVANRIRTHGDYHLGQVLRTANDFLIIDFEGEPSRPLSERRIKRPALRDVAGMLRSLHYAPYAVLFGQAEGTVVRSEDLPALQAGARFWDRWASAAFLRGYLAESAGASYLPSGREELRTLLDAYVIEKAVYEIRYELNNRPEWVGIPLRGVLELLT